MRPPLDFPNQNKLEQCPLLGLLHFYTTNKQKLRPPLAILPFLIQNEAKRCHRFQLCLEQQVLILCPLKRNRFLLCSREQVLILYPLKRNRFLLCSREQVLILDPLERYRFLVCCHSQLATTPCKTLHLPYPNKPKLRPPQQFHSNISPSIGAIGLILLSDMEGTLMNN